MQKKSRYWKRKFAFLLALTLVSTSINVTPQTVKAAALEESTRPEGTEKTEDLAQTKETDRTEESAQTKEADRTEESEQTKETEKSENPTQTKETPETKEFTETESTEETEESTETESTEETEKSTETEKINKTAKTQQNDDDIAEVENNLLKNGNFTDGQDNWQNWGDAATVTWNQGNVVFEINGDVADYAQSIYQELTLEEGAEYKVSFDIDSSIARSVAAGFDNTSKRDEYHTQIPAGKSTVTYTSKSAINGTNKFMIYLGTGAGSGVGAHTVTLSNISIVKIKNASQDKENTDKDSNGVITFTDYTIETYRSQDDNGWGGDSNVQFQYENDGKTAIISADSFGGSDWAVQWSIKNLTSSADTNNILIFDVVSTESRSIKYKIHDGDAMTSVALTANEKKTVKIPVSDKTISPFFDLSNGGAGSLTFTNFTFRPMTQAELDAQKKEEEETQKETLSIDTDALDLNSVTVETYCSQNDGGWGGDSNVKFHIDKSVAEISADGFGWNDWAVQLHINDLTSAKEENIFEFDVLSTIDKSIVYKNENSGETHTIELKANKVTHFVEEISGDTLNTTFDLHGGDKGVVQIANVKFVPVLELNKLVTDTYRSEDEGGWAGDSNAEFNFKKDAVVVKADNFGWNAWGIQWHIKDLVSTAAENTFEFDVVSSVDKDIVFKNEVTSSMQTISLKANEVKHFSENVSSSTMEATFDLSGGAKGGKLTFSHMRFGDAAASGQTISNGKGKEYDFSAKEDNAKNDYPDPNGVPKALEKDGYELIWADEFDGNYEDANVDSKTGLNLDNWYYQYGDGTTDCGNAGWGNNELEAYTGNQKNIGVNEDLSGDGEGNGLLRITASYEENGYKYADESTKKYTSARIRTTKKNDTLFTTTYGYIEARMSLPQTKGAWPAFWMLPESTAIYSGWPISGELDIMETTGINNDAACGTLHWGAPDHVYKGSGYETLNSEISYFHTYAVDWQPNSITWYYDGTPIYTATNWESGFASASDKTSFDAPFDMPFYVLLNLAVDSGQFGGSKNKAGFHDDINMYVDYVRVYQKAEGYPAYAEKSAGSSVADDWQKYEGQNQITDITTSNISTTMGEDKDTDLSKWYISTNANSVGGAASVSTVVDDNDTTWAKLNITEAGSQDYAVQLIGHYNAKKNYVYKVSFDAYAEGDIAGKTVNSDSKEWSGWSTNGIQSFELKKQPTKVSYTFVQKEDFDKCRIEFNLGSVGKGTVYIGNVKVEIVNPDSIGDESENRAVLSDGNVIYNGTFDQGSKHIGYWNTLKGTKLEVPRYTMKKLDADDVSVIDVASKTNYEKISNGVKYYERRAQISAQSNTKPGIYQNGFKMIADSYVLSFDMYSEKDTAVTVGIFSTDENGNPKDQIAASSIAYKAADGVKTFGLKLDVAKDIDNAAFVLLFDQGASVQVDNVSLKGTSQGVQADPTPVTGNTQWNGYSAEGQKIALTPIKNGYSMKNITSGATWYSPQLGSSNFQLIAGKQYELAFKYKLEGTTNNTFQYIIQENGGGWKIYNDGPTTLTYDAASADADGFCSYKVKFTADSSLNTVHLNFGFGNSGANGTTTFSFRDISMSLVKTESGETATDKWTDVKDNILDDGNHNNSSEPDKPSNNDKPSNQSKPSDNNQSSDTNSSGNNQSVNTSQPAKTTTVENSKVPLISEVPANTTEIETSKELVKNDSQQSTAKKSSKPAKVSNEQEDNDTDADVQEQNEVETEEQTTVTETAETEISSEEISEEITSETEIVNMEDEETPLQDTQTKQGSNIAVICVSAVGVAAIILALIWIEIRKKRNREI